MTAQAHPREQTAQLLWTGFIILFFVIQAIIWMVAIVMTSNDSSHAVVHDFDPKVSSLELQSRQETSKALGWKTDLTISQPESKSVSDFSHIELRVTNRDNLPINVSAIELSTFHCARAAEVKAVKLTKTAPGVYSGSFAFKKNGNWQFNGIIERDRDRFYFSERQYLDFSTGTP